jgi:isopenicillin-N epimerase
MSERLQSANGANRPNLKEISRRDFIRLSGMAAAGGALGLSLTERASAGVLPSAPGRMQNDFWHQVRKQFIIDPRVVYMNVGTTGAMPKQVLKNYSAYNQLAASHPRTFESELDAGFGLISQRQTLAAQFGCQPDEICLSRNTTDGLDAIIYGLALQPGDEILITHHEHIAALSPLNVIQDRYGVKITPVRIPVLDTSHAGQFVDAFDTAITSATKAILFSHITYKTGTRLPAGAICRLARDNGLISIVDGAHAPGMIELNFNDMGCDFYAAPGHKWQCGPGSTGLLYLRNHGDNLPEFWTQNSSLYTIFVQPTGNTRGEFDIALSLQYRGQLNIPAQLAMVDACNMWEQIGRDRIEAYICGLSSYLKQSLVSRFGSNVTLFSPDIPEFTSGLTSFNPFDDLQDGGLVSTLVNRLQEEAGYQVRSTNFHLEPDDQDYTYALRVSTHIFHNEAMIDGLVDAVFDIYQDMSG